MSNDSMKDLLRPRLKDYLNLITKPSRNGGRDMYICPLCGSGAHGGHDSDGAFHVTGDKWFCHSASCNKGGDIFTLYGLVNNLDLQVDFPEIIDGLSKELGVNQIDSAKNDFREEKKTVRKTDPEPVDEKTRNEDKARIDQIAKFASQLKGTLGESYLHCRGFSDATIEHFRLGFNPARWVNKTGKSYESIVIPYPGKAYYTERLIDPGEADKYQNQTGSAPLFVIDEDLDSDVYFITEGQLDAIALYEAQEKNIIACHYPNRLRDGLSNAYLSIGGAIIVGDRDPEEKRNPKTGKTPGEAQAESIAAILNDFHIPNVIVYPPGTFSKDVNDALIYDEIGLIGAIGSWKKELQDKIKEEQTKEEKERASLICNVSDYLLGDGFDEDIEYFKKYKDRKTGFENLDKYMTVFPGVCCLGGASSLGKTTFAVNLCDNLLDRGESVIYFTLEQLPIEIVTKSLARRLYEYDPMTVLTNYDIKEGATSEALKVVRKEYAEKASRYQIIEADFYWTVQDIQEYVEKYIKETGIKPIVVIDYLQLISSPEGFRGTEREKVDFNLKAIKNMSKNNELFILLLSSFNRASYIEPVSYESFKESGMIEHTCDYIFGLQLSILEDSDFFTQSGARGGEKEKNLDKKRKAVYDAQNTIEKEVELVSLKNRNGKQVFKCFFKYRMDYDTFKPDLESDHDPEVRKLKEYQESMEALRQSLIKQDEAKKKARRKLRAKSMATDGFTPVDEDTPFDAE